ncbi:glycoside hydrolase family 2 TIM barrel-domain containing protein [Psychromonas sp. MME2]|uniref:glycoside hydrolase family 2 TIM barrel-domain containing protein n=1 Tax=unclassified Psychromonas TaxID=2614957 RepID=UPI00339CF3DC
MNTPISPRITTLFNKNWQFQLARDEQRSDWHTVTLPHDWSILEQFSEQWDGATGYLPGGMGTYKKEFTNPLSADNQHAYLEFDGIYNNATIYLNDQKIHFQANGYAPFVLDITPFLSAENTLTIEVDRRRYVDSRWYTGSGIYRDVHLHITNQIHVPIWGSVITTQLNEDNTAEVTVDLSLTGLPCNQETAAQVATTISSVDSGALIQENIYNTTLSGNKAQVTIEHTINEAKKWHPDTPHLYQLNAKVIVDNQVVDCVTDTFGVRKIAFCKDNGFSINDQLTPIKGVCLHHDGGLVGAAVPDEVWVRRLNKLKACGVNAVRIAHNPASKRLLNLCDRLGVLVQDEFFDEWDFPKDKRLNMNDQHDDFISRGYTEHFQTDAEKDLKNTLKSHINHPSIFMWSIGNEIEWTYPRNVEATGFFDVSWDGNYFWSQPPHSPKKIKNLLDTLPEHQYNIGKTAQKLAKWVKELDTTRPVTANCILPSTSYLSGYADALDVIGFSYRRVIYDYAHQHYPNLPIIGNENLSQWHEWKAVSERPFVSGLFLWTGVNYMGETHGQWPTRTTDSGLLDAAGFEKSSFYLFQSLWSDEPIVHMTTIPAKEREIDFDIKTYHAQESDPDAWEQKLWVWPESNQHWNYQKDELILIEAVSNCETLTLFINGQSYGSRLLTEQKDRTFRWVVPFVEGKIELIGYDQDKIRATQSLTTSGAISDISVKDESANNEQYKQLVIQLMDFNGVPIKHQQQRLTFQLSGDITWVGADNGSIKNSAAHGNHWIQTKEGRALAIVKVLPGQKGELTVSLEDTQNSMSGQYSQTISLSTSL